uniref:Uncharacterized protein ycf15 n=1 Tax=Solanum lycopersicum TaxID=4081 RepID=A0A3Q7EVH4_SOLLC
MHGLRIDIFPMPFMDHMLDRLAGKGLYFFVMDIRDIQTNKYWLRIGPEWRRKAGMPIGVKYIEFTR